MATHEREGIMMTAEDAAYYDELSQKIEYFDRLQYCYKIKLNSCYGALLNKYFRFHDARNGESTTGTGRAILRHMCGTANEIIVGIHDPLGEAVLYGDTDSCYFRIFSPEQIDHTIDRELTIQAAIVEADRISAEINKTFPAFIRDSFLCTPGYDGLINAGREVVAPRGIFVTPKRYMLDVADIEGRRVQDLKVMGLDTKKTILPKYVQDALNDFLCRFLRYTPWEQISQEIVDFKDKMRVADISTLGLPKGVNKVELYNTILLNEGASARLPGHVRAAIYYNSMLDKYDDKDSIRITSGMKCRVFYLKRPVGKFKAIALPTDLRVIPQWFIDNIQIDVDLQIEKLIDKPLENILKVIGKVPPSKQTLFLDTLLEF